MKTIDEIMERRNQIKAEMEQDGADLDALENEVRELKTMEEEIRKSAAADAEKRRMIAEGLGNTTEAHQAEPEQRSLDDIRNSKEYIDAYAEFIRTGESRECRSLLTVNAANGGTIPVPIFLQEKIETAWENDEILSRVSKTYLKGNIKVPFELSADGAYIHGEGTTAPTEEALTFGLVTLTPETIKKWVSFSDEVQDMKGQEFLDYIYDELLFRITKKLAEEVLDDVTTANATHGSTAIGVPQVTAAPSVVAIPTAVANLSEDARNVCVVMNRLTEVNFLAAQAAGNFSIDPFAGIPRVYSSHLPAYDSADGGAVYAVVGDLSAIRVNYPAGDGVVIKYDELTRKKEDIVEVLGRQYAAHGITKLGRLVNVKKPSGTSE